MTYNGYDDIHINILTKLRNEERVYFHKLKKSFLYLTEDELLKYLINLYAEPVPTSTIILWLQLIEISNAFS